MPNLIEKIREDLANSQKDRDEVAVSTLRFLISKIDNAKIAKGSDLTDDEVLTEIEKDAKRHKESITAFDQAGRRELAEKEKAELAVLEKYLPEKMSDEEIGKIVDDVISQVGAKTPADMGKVMSGVMGRVKGEADGSIVSEIVKGKLNG